MIRSIALLLAVVSSSTSGTAYAQTTADASAFYGTWSVTSAQTTVLISIEPQGKAVFVFIREGSHSSTRADWEVFHGGVLVKTIPRVRLWSGRHDDELRAEMEPLSGTVDQMFLDRFFMRRVEERPFPPALERIPFPESWSKEVLDVAWDETAGRRTLPPQQVSPRPIESQTSQTQGALPATPPQTSRPDVVSNVLQRDDPMARSRSLEELLAMLDADASDATKIQGLMTLRQCLTAKFDRLPFRERVLPMLRSTNVGIRSEALMCLPGLGGGAADVPAVVPLTRDLSPIVRGHAGSAIIRLGAGERADIVIPALTLLLHDSDAEVIERTIRSMWGQYSSPEFDELLVRMSHDEHYHSIVIYHALSTMPRKSVTVCRRLVAELGHPDWNNSGRAAWGLTYGVTDEAKSFVEEGLLKALAEETNEYTREQEFRALRNIATSASREYLEFVVSSQLETDRFKKLAREILEGLDGNP